MNSLNNVRTDIFNLSYARSGRKMSKDGFCGLSSAFAFASSIVSTQEDGNLRRVHMHREMANFAIIGSCKRSGESKAVRDA